MASAKRLADGGLIRGTTRINIDGADYILKTQKRQKPIRSDFEYDENSLPDSGDHVIDFQKMPVTIMAKRGVQEPSQLVPFRYDGKWWLVGNLDIEGSVAGLTAYSAEIIEHVNEPAAV